MPHEIASSGRAPLSLPSNSWPVLMKTLLDAGFLHGDCITITGKTVAENRKARHEYFITDTYEAGIQLTGTEVKALRVATPLLRWDAEGS